jgi:glycosyltransferase involved in cell wall biosynthesis
MRDADVVHVMANSGWAWHLFAAPPVWIARARKVPVIVNYRGGDAERFLSRQAALVLPTIARAACVTVPSGFLAGIFARYSIATTVVPNVVNLDAFYPAPEPPEVPHLVATRNLEAIYDIGTAIRALAIVRSRHPETRLTVAGSGPDRAALEALARDLGLEDAVRFTGRLDNADLPALYRTASIAVNPSLVDNMPISLLEAMACGVPIVTTSVGGVPSLVRDGDTALMTDARRPEAMAAAIVRLIEDRALAMRLRARGLERARDFAWPEVRGVLLRVYAQARSADREAASS